METDLFLVLGVAILWLALPALISAYSDARPPRAGALMLVIGGGMIAWAIFQNPGAYTWRELPDVIIRVIADYFRHLSQ